MTHFLFATFLGAILSSQVAFAQMPPTTPAANSSPGDMASPRVDNTLDGTGVITGCVYQDGQPAAGIVVEAEMKISAYQRLSNAWLVKHGTPLKDKAGKVMGYGYSSNGADTQPVERTRVAIATTASDGSYRISGVTTAPYDIMALPPGTTRSTFPQTPWEWVAAASTALAQDGQSVNAPDLVLTHGAIIQGHVVDAATGKPLSGIIVNVQGPMCPESSDETISAVTDSQGHYSFRVPPARVRWAWTAW